MTNFIERLIEADLAGKVFTTIDLQRVLGGTAAKRYGLINRALKKDEIIQLKRGIYILGKKYYSAKLSLYYMASQIEQHSYISLESALSYHGWLPEKVTMVTSVINHGRTKTIKNPIAEFNYTFIPINKFEFLTMVKRIYNNGKPFLIAKPLRALMDYVYEKKIDWLGLDYIVDSLRIELESLLQVDFINFANIIKVYRSKRVLRFAKKLQKELKKYE